VSVSLLRCSRCGQDKPATNEHFAPRLECRRAWSSRCRECLRIIDRERRPSGSRSKGGRGNRRLRDGRQERRCSRCRSWFPEDAEFSPIKRQDGVIYRNSWCRSCVRKRARERMQQRRADETEALRVRDARRRHQKSPRGRQWRRQRLAIDNAIRRQRLTGAPSTLTPAQWSGIVGLLNGRCTYCGKLPSRLELDHVIPVCAEDYPGTILGNVVPACPDCNQGKGSRRVEQWRPGIVPQLLTVLARIEAESLG
jgi:5-methylcytosine-specific restriction endonuclease McrA